MMKGKFDKLFQVFMRGNFKLLIKNIDFVLEF